MSMDDFTIDGALLVKDKTPSVADGWDMRYEHTRQRGLMWCWRAVVNVTAAAPTFSSVSILCFNSRFSVRSRYKKKAAKISLNWSKALFSCLTDQSLHTFISTCSSISLVLIVVYSFSNLKDKRKLKITKLEKSYETRCIRLWRLIGTANKSQNATLVFINYRLKPLHLIIYTIL